MRRFQETVVKQHGVKQLQTDGQTLKQILILILLILILLIIIIIIYYYYYSKTKALGSLVICCTQIIYVQLKDVFAIPLY